MPAPIPFRLLPSTMEVRVPADGDFGGEFAEPVMIGNVRFASVEEVTPRLMGGGRTGYVFSDGSKGLVYVDALNSAGAFEVPEGSLVSVDGGSKMSVVKNTRLEDFDGHVHHWEIEVR